MQARGLTGPLGTRGRAFLSAGAATATTGQQQAQRVRRRLWALGHASAVVLRSPWPLRMRRILEPVTLLTWAMPWLSRSSTPIWEGVMPFLASLAIMSPTCGDMGRHGDHVGRLRSGLRCPPGRRHRPQSCAVAPHPRPHLGGGDLQPGGAAALVGQSRAALALAVAVHATHGGRLLSAAPTCRHERGREGGRAAGAVRHAACAALPP